MIKIPDCDTILRLTHGKHVDTDENGKEEILGTAFIGRPSDKGNVSYNCLEMLHGDREAAVQHVRETTTLRFTGSYRFVSLNVGVAMSELNVRREDAEVSEVLHDPIDASDEAAEDLSHCVMTNIPENESSYASLIGEILSECVQDVYMAKLKK